MIRSDGTAELTDRADGLLRQAGRVLRPVFGAALPVWRNRSIRAGLPVAAAAVGVSFALVAQATGTARITTVLGQHMAVELVELRPDGVLTVRAGRPSRKQQGIALREIVAIHAAVPSLLGSVEVHLVGGERLHGELRAGDSDGETFGLESPSLGRVAIPVDRLAAIIFRDQAGDARREDFVIPADSAADEALFRRARSVGFSRVLGSIYRFREHSVLFEPGEGDAVREVDAFRYDDLAAIVLRGGFPREQAPQAYLLTRSGDFVGVDVRGFADGTFTFAAEGVAREFRLPLEDVAALTMLGAGRRFLSDLPTESVVERAYFEDAGVLLPFVRDHDVTGGHLVAGDVVYGKGLGVHSRSALAWRVPEGAKSFLVAVGLDDSVRSLGLRASVRVAVKLDDEVLFEREELTAADGAVQLGLLRVKPGALLTLEVDFGRGLDLGDRVDWLGAVFLD